MTTKMKKLPPLHARNNCKLLFHSVHMTLLTGLEILYSKSKETISDSDEEMP